MSGNLIESRQSISRNYFHIGRTSQCHHPTPMQVVWPVCSESVVDSLERPTSTQETGVHIPSQIGLQDIGKKVTLWYLFFCDIYCDIKKEISPDTCSVFFMHRLSVYIISSILITPPTTSITVGSATILLSNFAYVTLTVAWTSRDRPGGEIFRKSNTFLKKLYKWTVCCSYVIYM